MMGHGRTRWGAAAGWAGWLGLAVGVLTLAACGGQSRSAVSATGKANGGKTTIAALVFQNDQFYRMCELGMKKAAEEYNVNLLVGDTNNSLDKEVSLVDTYVDQGVKAIVLAPASLTASIPALKRANHRGIAIVTYDTHIKADFPKCSIESDQVSLGRTTGEVARKYIQEKLGGKAKVAIIDFISLVPESGGMRVRGFKEAIAGLPGVKIVSEQEAWLAPQAANKVQSILTAQPDVNLIWAANEGGTVGAVTAVKAAGKAGHVVVFGTDMSAQIASFLLSPDNILQAVTGQKPFDIGFGAMRAAVRSLKGEPVQAKIRLPGILFTRDKPDEIRAYRTKLQQMSR